MQKISLAVSLWILTSTRLFTMFQDYSVTFCETDIIPATFLNARCGTQAFLVTFGTHSAALWASLRAYTVLALIIYQRSFTSTRWIIAINAICWGIPLAFATGVIGSKTVGYGFSGFCGPKASLQPFLFFLPILVLSQIESLITDIHRSRFLCISMVFGQDCHRISPWGSHIRYFVARGMTRHPLRRSPTMRSI
jgi:hypothetical protein